MGQKQDARGGKRNKSVDLPFYEETRLRYICTAAIGKVGRGRGGFVLLMVEERRWTLLDG